MVASALTHETLGSEHTAPRSTQAKDEAQGLPNRHSGMGTHPVSRALGASLGPSADERKWVSNKSPAQCPPPPRSAQLKTGFEPRGQSDEKLQTYGLSPGAGPVPTAPVKHPPPSGPYRRPQCCSARGSVLLPAETDGQTDAGRELRGQPRAAPSPPDPPPLPAPAVPEPGPPGHSGRAAGRPSPHPS